MNTTVEYKLHRPTGRYGEYRSTTRINHNGITGYIKISLVWFVGLGWYYAIELQGWAGPWVEGPGTFILNYSNDKRIWKKGKELSLCAQAAEIEATEMCEVYEITGLKFEPYILPRKI